MLKEDSFMIIDNVVVISVCFFNMLLLVVVFIFVDIVGCLVQVYKANLNGRSKCYTLSYD